MSKASQQVLESFEQLPDPEKHQVAIEILRRTLSIETPALTDEELILSAETVFLALDEAEAGK